MAIVVFFLSVSFMYDNYESNSRKVEREQYKERDLLREIEKKIHVSKNLQGYQRQYDEIQHQLTSNLAISPFFKEPKQSLDWCLVIEKNVQNSINCQLDELTENEFYYQQLVTFDFNGSLTDVNQFIALFAESKHLMDSPIALKSYAIKSTIDSDSFDFSGTLAVYVENPYEE